jgi:hypothetical protein
MTTIRRLPKIIINYTSDILAVIEEEVEFIIEITAAFMRHFYRFSIKDSV